MIWVRHIHTCIHIEVRAPRTRTNLNMCIVPPSVRSCEAHAACGRVIATRVAPCSRSRRGPNEPWESRASRIFSRAFKLKFLAFWFWCAAWRACLRGVPRVPRAHAESRKGGHAAYSACCAFRAVCSRSRACLPGSSWVNSWAACRAYTPHVSL